ncbi:hypothetical protein B8036_10800 [Klebsiella pneumoniae]|nr:hypothetical protein B5M01_04290 [Klebsiella pneumoniae]OVJ44664.1 hypothetical protein B8036_10800 [Klebsiella pneumoniae]
MMSLWDALRMNMMISYQELVRTFLRYVDSEYAFPGKKFDYLLTALSHSIYAVCGNRMILME